MSTDLFGVEYTGNWEYARKLVTIGAKMPFYKVNSYFTDSGSWIDLVMDKRFVFQPEKRDISVGGLYAIYEKTPDNKYQCLYVGMSSSSIRNRIYRFMKELHGFSRHDENHPAAKKARKSGVNPENIYAKFFTISEIFRPIGENYRVNLDTLDETCAILLKSRFNKRKKA